MILDIEYAARRRWCQAATRSGRSSGARAGPRNNSDVDILPLSGS